MSYNDRGNITYLLLPKSISNLCKSIQSNDIGRKRCYENDSKAIEDAIKTKKAEIYCCHAGLTSIVLPVIINNRNIGNIFAGPLLTHKLSDKEIKKHIDNFKKLNLDLADEFIRKSYQDIKICKKSDIRFARNMLSLLAHFISYKEIARKSYREKNIVDDTIDLHEKIKILQDKLNVVMPFLKIETKKEENLTFHQKAVKRAKEYIDSNLDKAISLKEVATIAALSPTYFSYVFKKETKINFEDYFISARIEKAKELLKKTTYSIGEIAYNIGYNDQNYFSFLFKRITGISPRNYRNKSMLNS